MKREMEYKQQLAASQVLKDAFEIASRYVVHLPNQALKIVKLAATTTGSVFRSWSGL